MKFYLLNVFTRFLENSGNQLAVVMPEEDLSDEVMLEVTKNFNFSETVFISKNRHLRIMTPGGELPFAGHPTVGAAYVWNKVTHEDSFDLHTKLGTIKCQTKNDSALVVFPGAPSVKEAPKNLSKIIQAYGVDPKDADLELARSVNSGPEFILIPLKNHEALKKAHAKEGEKSGRFYFIFPESKTRCFVRMFSQGLGKAEDAATGSAACALAGYLREIQNQPEGNLKIYQGEEMMRPSEIHLKWNQDISIGGKVTLWAEGNLPT